MSRDELDMKRKNALDPMNAMKRYVNAKRKVEGKPPELAPPAKKMKAIEFVKTETKVAIEEKKTEAISSSESDSETVRCYLWEKIVVINIKRNLSFRFKGATQKEEEEAQTQKQAQEGQEKEEEK